MNNRKTKSELALLERNPLFDPDSVGGTVENCAAVVTYLQETLTLSNTLQESCDVKGLSPNGITGLYFVLEAVKQALEAERERDCREHENRICRAIEDQQTAARHQGG